MRKTIAIAAAILLAAALSFGGVVKTSKSEITFKKFGSFTSEQTEKVTAEKRLAETDGSFKGKGLLGGVIKLFFPTGKTGDLVDLSAKTITTIDHKRKEFTVTPIEKFVADRNAALESQKESKPETTESDIKIVRSEFKVEETGETKTINSFPCTKFVARWITDWVNTRTGDKGTDRLETILWTTPSESLSAAFAEETAFGSAYLKAMGLDANKLQSDVLGTQWMSILAGLDPAGGGAKMNAGGPSAAQEMSKVKGYPIVIDGQYFAQPKSKAQAESQESGGGLGGGLGGTLGKLGAGLLKKKADPEADKAPTLAFYTEVKSISVSPVDGAELQVPAGYKNKSK